MKKTIFLLLAFIVTERATAQVELRSLQDVLKYADNHAFTIKSSQVQQQANEAKKLQSQSFLYPTITVASGYTDNLTLQPTLVPAQLFNPTAADGEFKEMTFGKQHVYNAGVQAQWDIVNFQKIFATKTANDNIRVGQLNTQKVKYDTYNQVASTYYSILLTLESINIYSENSSATKVILDNAHEKYKKGIISEEDLNRVSIQHIQNEKKIENARYNLKQLYNQLQSQLGTTEEIIVSGNIESQIIDNPTITNTNPEVLWQESQVKVSESKLKQTKAINLPSLSFAYQYNNAWATNNFMDFSNANKLPSQYFGIKLSATLFDGFSKRGKVKEAKAELQIQQMQLENTQLLKLKEDETLQLQYVQSLNSLNKAKEMLDLQKANDLHSGNRYESGVISLDQRMDRYEDLLEVQYHYIQDLVDYSIAQYRIYIRQMNFNQEQ